MNLGFVLAVFLAIFFLNSDKDKITHFFRLLYPALLFTFFYRQTGGLMKLIFPEFLDYQLTAFEKSIFGVYPTFWIEQNVLNVWLTEILSGTYFLYYPMIGVYLLVLYFKKRFQLIKQSLTAIAITFFISYMLFYLYPLEGPRYFFEGQYMFDITGPIFRPMVELAQQGSVRGGCMPSSHIAVALVINIFFLKHFKKVGILLLINNIGMALGTFYGRYHYISDVVVGVVIGISVTWLTLRYYNRFDHPETIATESKQE
jgi:membrane-associated phospholipid phosphatase